MSLYGLQVLQEFSGQMAIGSTNPEVDFRQQGNLFIVDAASRTKAEQGYALQRSLGCEVEWLSPEQVQLHYPFYNLEGCVGGTFGRKDGTMSSEAVLNGYRKKAVSLGAQFIHAQAERLLVRDDRIGGVQLATGRELAAGAVVNSAGAWAAEIARSAGVELPIAPTKRQVTVLETKLQPDGLLPPIFFPSGLYCIHEGEGHFTCAHAHAIDPIGCDDFRWERKRFENLLWGELVAVMPTFESLKISGGWAGLYAVNTFDGNAILGEWPGLHGFFLANGFSGHGFQQCHAVGRYIAELILGERPSLDLSIFSPKRILQNKPVFENERMII
jgi:glycine/D-amino acid oxidase-like deaminating enzyme